MRGSLRDDDQTVVGFDGSRSWDDLDELPFAVYTPPERAWSRQREPQRAPTYVDDDGTTVHAVTTLPARE